MATKEEIREVAGKLFDATQEYKRLACMYKPTDYERARESYISLKLAEAERDELAEKLAAMMKGGE